MPKTFHIESLRYRCKFCETELPVVKIEEKGLATYFTYDSLDLTQIKRVGNNLFHLSCTEKEEFIGWYVAFTKRTKK